MAPVVIDIRSVDDSRDVVHQAVQAVNGGAVTCLPLPASASQLAEALGRALDVRKVLLQLRAREESLRQATASSRSASVQLTEASICPVDKPSALATMTCHTASTTK